MKDSEIFGYSEYTQKTVDAQKLEMSTDVFF